MAAFLADTASTNPTNDISQILEGSTKVISFVLVSSDMMFF